MSPIVVFAGIKAKAGPRQPVEQQGWYCVLYRNRMGLKWGRPDWNDESALYHIIYDLCQPICHEIAMEMSLCGFYSGFIRENERLAVESRWPIEYS